MRSKEKSDVSVVSKLKRIFNPDRCLMCNRYIPEGGCVCRECYKDIIGKYPDPYEPSDDMTQKRSGKI